ncbi:MAG: hypothetical protein WA602_12595, partial [Silvibacterium sp.]
SRPPSGVATEERFNKAHDLIENGVQRIGCGHSAAYVVHKLNGVQVTSVRRVSASMVCPVLSAAVSCRLNARIAKLTCAFL